MRRRMMVMKMRSMRRIRSVEKGEAMPGGRG